MDRIASHPRHVMFGRRAAALAVKLLNKMQNGSSGARLAQLARLLSFSHYGAAGAANRPHLLIFAFEKEPTAKTDMSPFGLIELTPEKGDRNLEKVVLTVYGSSWLNGGAAVAVAMRAFGFLHISRTIRSKDISAANAVLDTV